MLFSSNAGDDLFEDLAPSNPAISADRSDALERSMHENSDSATLASVTPEEIHSLSQEPEALDFIPEFTNQPTEISSVDSPKTFADLEIGLSGVFDDNIDENSQLLSEDVAVANSTYIQIETARIENDLLATENYPDINLKEISDLASSQIQPSDLFNAFNDSTDENSELLFEDVAVANSTYIQIETTDNIENDLSFTEAANQKELIENVENTANIDLQTANDFTQTVIQEPIVAGSDFSLDESNLETDENLEADLSEHVWDLEETDEPALVNEEENAIVSSTEELEVASVSATTETSQLVALENDRPILDEFADLEALLGEEVTLIPNATSIPEVDFVALEALLSADNDQTAAISNYQQSFATQPVLIPPHNTAKNAVSSPRIEDEFGDLEKLLAEADQTISHSSLLKSNTGKNPRSSTRRAARFEETMKVPVKQLDDMSNLVGEIGGKSQYLRAGS